MSFTTRLQQNLHSISGLDLSQALEKGIEYTLSLIGQNPALLEDFSTTLESVANGINWQSDVKGLYLLNVSRKDGSVFREARKVSASVKDRIADSSSIHFATALSPAYYLEGAKIYMSPIAGSGSEIKLEVVQNINGYSFNDSNEKIYNADGNASTQSGFPVQFNELVVLHASETLLIEKLSNFASTLPTDLDGNTTLFDEIADVSASISYTFPTSDFNDAITKAQNLIDGTTMGGDTENESVQYWLNDEDEDMVQVTLATAAQELSRANVILSEFNAELGGQSAQKQQALAEFQANLAKKIQLYNTVIQKIQVDYQWMTQQLQLITSKKQEFIQLNITPKKLDTNERQV